jgi:hypothetical protein
VFGSLQARRSSRPNDPALLVEILEQVVSRKLDLLVTPLGGPEVAGDDPGPVHPAKVATDERVSRLGFVGCSLREPEMPLGILAPRVVLEEDVLLFRPGLDLAPVAVEHVLAGVDEAPRVSYRAPIDGI